MSGRFPFRGMDVRHRGAGPKDQCFTLMSEGMVNVTKIHLWLRRRPDLFQFVASPLTAELVDIVRRNRDLDPFRLQAMTPEEVDSRFAVAIDFPDGVQTIDGNHYIVRAHQLGREVFRVALVPPRLIPRFRVVWEVRERGRWRPITAAELLAAQEGVYSQPDGRIVDAAGAELARIPR